MTRREDDRGHGYDNGAATGASAMVGNGEGERQGEWRVQGRGQQAVDALASSRTPASPPCLPGGDEAAGWHGPAQCWAARWAGWGFSQVSPFFSLFLFFLFILFCVLK